MSSKYLLEVKQVSKNFDGVKALDKVSFELNAGEIHALMGENGAGKSTFIKIVTGVHMPNEGSLFLDGEKINFHNTRDALKQGIVAIYQHSTSYPHLSATENIFIGHEEVGKISKRILWKQMNKKVQQLLDELGAEFKTETVIGNLSVAKQQIVEIAKALSTHAKIIIMDEPTSSLTRKESEELYLITEKMRDRGVGIIFVSHRMEDVYRLASKVTVFRDSKYIGTWSMDNVNEHDLIYAMVGRDIDQLYPARTSQIGEVVLEGRNLSKIGWFKDINFEVRSGEVLSFTGLIGSGRTEVFQALMGINELDGGAILLDDKKIKRKHPSIAHEKGIGYLPEDRHLQGLILDWNLVKNVTLSSIDNISVRKWIKNKKEISISKDLAEKLDVKINSVFDRVGGLSGGNQQKVVITKLLALNSRVLILDEPTKGVDVGAKLAIYEIINELAAQGLAIIMISSEMPEVIAMSDRIIVMREGRITKVFEKNQDRTQELILEAAMLQIRE